MVEEYIDSLVQMKVSHDENIECSICSTSKLEIGTNYAILTPCGHTFCYNDECQGIKTWLQSNNTCPTCRQLLPFEVNSERRSVSVGSFESDSLIRSDMSHYVAWYRSFSNNNEDDIRIPESMHSRIIRHIEDDILHTSRLDRFIGDGRHNSIFNIFKNNDCTPVLNYFIEKENLNIFHI